MLLIGLTGGIATGKSTVSTLLGAPPYSLPVIDADVLARTAVAPGTRAYRQIVSHFGPSTPDLLVAPSSPDPANPSSSQPVGEHGPDGAGRPLDRAALGRRVFGAGADSARDRAALNGIVHPAVRRAMAGAVLREYARGSRAAVLDVPLLFEGALDVFCGVVLVVALRDGQLQLRRLMDRDRAAGRPLSEQEARGRIESQEDVQAKVARCLERGDGWGKVVWNDGDRAQLERELAKVMLEVEARSPPWWETLLWLCPPLAVGAGVYALWHARAARLRYERKVKAKL